MHAIKQINVYLHFVIINLLGEIMKKLVVLTLSMLAVSSSAFSSDIKFVAKSVTEEAQACIDAASGKVTIADLANKMGLSIASLNREVQCNGVTISKFAKQFKAVKSSDNSFKTENNYALNVKHANKDAQLCLIAATGDMAKLKRVTRAQGTNVKRFIKHSSCNNQSVADFVSQYGGEQAALNLRKSI